ncbi:hypothetical protein MNBD_GAMMA12-1059 [hydrothermal vent metagenome]|uniref:Uncharacterized protein n=1 Tax=hydrothermal vent metagenome TaxID=652676 RepID=A0A3B0Z7L5_9ZZZZ
MARKWGESVNLLAIQKGLGRLWLAYIFVNLLIFKGLTDI